MKNIKALLKLDVELVKPYWKWLVMFFAIALLTGILMGGGIGFLLSWTIFVGTILAFPFENVEKGNMEMLYAILPTNRKSMIFSRYLFILIGLASALIMGLSLGILIDFITYQVYTPSRLYDMVYGERVYRMDDFGRYIYSMRNWALPIYFQMMFTMLALSFAVYAIATGVQTPFFYKYGYKKGRIFMWIPIILIMIVINLPLILGWFDIDFNLLNFILLEQGNRLIASLVFVGVGIVFFVGSYLLSRKMYLNKNL